jgi:hypothetical protein
VTKLVWEMQSHKRYSARCGPGRVEVRRVGIAGVNRHWVVGEVFGQHHHSSSKYPCPDGMALHEAQAMAECVAADMIAEFAKSPLGSAHAVVVRGG